VLVWTVRIRNGFTVINGDLVLGAIAWRRDFRWYAVPPRICRLRALMPLSPADSRRWSPHGTPRGRPCATPVASPMYRREAAGVHLDRQWIRRLRFKRGLQLGPLIAQ